MSHLRYHLFSCLLIKLKYYMDKKEGKELI